MEDTLDLCPQLLCIPYSEAETLYLRAASLGFVEPAEETDHDD